MPLKGQLDYLKDQCGTNHKLWFNALIFHFIQSPKLRGNQKHYTVNNLSLCYFWDVRLNRDIIFTGKSLKTY